MRTTAIITILALTGLFQAPLQAGDAGAGASAFNAKGCVGCHGASGKKPIANYPVVGGKPADFIAGELNRFRSGERNNPIMGPMATALSDSDIANLAAYLATQ
ncbi:MAG: cytochrome c [Gammaproteobacteria bacterium]|nr:cytochrome c [Gammaproteobacteria bacterium]MDH3448389.1 cytochrome c [Gammaproteobacteria bacterium]